MNPNSLALALALAACLLASVLPGQTSRATTTPGKTPGKTIDWPAMVEKAHTHRRVMLRRAASRRVAAAGDAAVAAVRAFEKKHGRNAISLDFVTAYGRVDSTGPATLSLIGEWVHDPDFYWRAQALEALANRRLSRFEKLFSSRIDDPAFLTRIQAGRGLCLLHAETAKVLALLRDVDPRVRLRIATCLTGQRDDRGLPTLVESLRQDASCLDYPWGTLSANRAFKVLAKVLFCVFY